MTDAQAHLDDVPTVLLVDDSDFVHRLLESRLKSENIRLICETNGEKGLKRAIEEQPSLILLDIDMPVMDGYEMIRHLVELPETKNIPVIVISGTDTVQDKVTMFDMGAMDFVSKPFELTELRARIRASLRISSLLRMLEQKAQIDGLTGLFNRTYFDQRWQQEYERAARQKTALSVVMLDIDHFKSVNDSFGHPAGDSVIEGVAVLIQRHMRQYDIACRYGGEEFAFILPETTPDQARSLCERVRTECEQAVWPQLTGRQITVSVGIYGCEAGPAATAEDFVELADKALYTAKQTGRNKTQVNGESGPTIGITRAG